MRLSIFFDLLLNVRRATFFIVAKQSFSRGSWFPIVLQNALYEYVRLSFGLEFDDFCNVCNLLSRWAQLQDVTIFTDSDLQV